MPIAIAAVDGRDREVLLLRAWEGLDGHGIAHALGISRSGADAERKRIKRWLKEAIELRDGGYLRLLRGG